MINIKLLHMYNIRLGLTLRPSPSPSFDQIQESKEIVHQVTLTSRGQCPTIILEALSCIVRRPEHSQACINVIHY